MTELKKGAHVHLMGICGTAMASLAGLLKEQGFRVTGSDQNVYPPMSTFLQDQGIEIMQGYRAQNLHPRPDFVVVGNVISSHFEEAKELMRLNLTHASLPETLRDQVIRDCHSIVVAGTHGKTTTTSMAAWVCEQEGLNPGFMIGGIAKNFSQSFQNPRADHFVIEGDEYDTAFFAKVPKFLFYKPRSVILSSIEFDHADIYADLEAVLKSFRSLLEIIPKDEGLLVYNVEDENIAGILDLYPGKKISYGFEEGDWSTDAIEFLKEGIHFDVVYKGKTQERLFVPMFGEYNITNALSVYALGKELGFALDFKEAFASFQGVKRRQELIGTPRGVQVIEDFAHHPTAVAATIRSFKKRKDAGKLFVVFEPRSNTSRRKLFQQEYTEALKPADVTFISEPFAGTHPTTNDDRLDVHQIVNDLGGNSKAQVFTEVEEAIKPIVAEAESGDTVLIMSNGGFQGIYQKVLLALDK